MNEMTRENSPPILDVSGLPDYGFDSRSPVWWGNLLMIFIESTTILLLLASYFYCWRNEPKWPPPMANQPSWDQPFPSFRASTANLIIMLTTCIAVFWTDKAARRIEQKKVVIGLWFMFVVSIMTMVLRFYEFPGLRFHWNDNAYASIVWAVLVLHFTYLLLAFGEFFIMALWLVFHKLDMHRAHDVTLAGGGWYWIAGMYVLIYLVIYVSPRLL
jgi:cytochrome c oxidase subunit 3